MKMTEKDLEVAPIGTKVKDSHGSTYIKYSDLRNGEECWVTVWGEAYASYEIDGKVEMVTPTIQERFDSAVAGMRVVPVGESIPPGTPFITEDVHYAGKTEIVSYPDGVPYYKIASDWPPRYYVEDITPSPSIPEDTHVVQITFEGEKMLAVRDSDGDWDVIGEDYLFSEREILDLSPKAVDITEWLV